jgi:hypothetical protein
MLPEDIVAQGIQILIDKLGTVAVGLKQEADGPPEQEEYFVPY